MKKIIRRTSVTIFIMSMLWMVLTIWVELQGPARHWTNGEKDSPIHVAIIFDPDPLYDLDEQVCFSLGRALAERDIYVEIFTVAAADSISSQIDAFIICANTYNWQPDWAITDFIKDSPSIRHQKIFAITLGSGSTATAKRKLESLVKRQEGDLVDSRTLWLMRPNDESKMSKSNVLVANELAYQWGIELATSLKK